VSPSWRAAPDPGSKLWRLEMTAVEISADSAEGTIAWPDGRQQNVPSGPDAFFDRASYPALFS
jgi:hypothetical protein